MFVTPPEVVDVAPDFCGFDQALESLPNAPAVVILWPREGAPYLARTTLLRRRMLRLLRERTQPSRLLNLRSIVARIEFWRTASQLESSLVSYELARRYFPDTYVKLLKLRMPSYLKLSLDDPYPRTQVTTRVRQAGGGRGIYYGPFRSRAAAEHFEREALDLFQIRRCQETLAPRPEHPGCIYGEMNMCLRPCQQAVGQSEYQSEVDRVAEFLSTNGASLLHTIASARQRFSEEMNFEDAGRQHKRYEKIQQVLSIRDEIVRQVDRMFGVAVTGSTAAGSVRLWFFLRGVWQSPVDLSLEASGDKMVSLDERLRELVASICAEGETRSRVSRQEHLALLARWYYSSWRDGEWLSFDEPTKVPYRKLVKAISRVAPDSLGPQLVNPVIIR